MVADQIAKCSSYVIWGFFEQEKIEPILRKLKNKKKESPIFSFPIEWKDYYLDWMKRLSSSLNKYYANDVESCNIECEQQQFTITSLLWI